MPPHVLCMPSIRARQEIYEQTEKKTWSRQMTTTDVTAVLAVVLALGGSVNEADAVFRHLERSFVPQPTTPMEAYKLIQGTLQEVRARG